jgi:hypothetical protein
VFCQSLLRNIRKINRTGYHQFCPGGPDILRPRSRCVHWVAEVSQSVAASPHLVRRDTALMTEVSEIRGCAETSLSEWSLYWVSLFYTGRGNSRRMAFRSPSAIPDNATRKSISRSRALVLSCHHSWKQIFRPCALGFIGLAIAVTLCGFGRKLSLYYYQATGSSRVPVVRMWIEPEKVSVATLSVLKTKSHLVTPSPAFPISVQWLPRLDRTFVCMFSEHVHRPASFSFLIPFRSPPRHRFMLT